MLIILLRILLLLMCYCFNGIRAHKNPQKILSIEANCTRDLMHLKINVSSGRQFKGMLFAKGFMEECNSRAGSNLLTLPLTSCGVKSRMLSKDTVQYSVRIVVQHSSKLQQKSDMLVTAKCEMGTELMDYNIDSHEMKSQRNGRMRFFKPTSTKIRSWLEIEAAKAEYALVGENATLSAIAIVPRSIGMRIVDCIAFDGVGDSSQKLFDENGCAVEDIVPAFTETIVNVEDGWSKAHEDDTVKKIFSTSFRAFKFPDKDIIHFNCGIILCKGDCPKECNDIVENQLLQKPLARLEIFNSIRVIAPQIESLDRMGRNLSVAGEHPQAQSAYLGPDILCVSQSRLAIAFCTLGIIFLLAVLVAIVCSIRYLSQRRNYRRARPPSDINSGRRSIFSLSSSSNNFSQSSLDFDSKLFAYGRVY